MSSEPSLKSKHVERRPILDGRSFRFKVNSARFIIFLEVFLFLYITLIAQTECKNEKRDHFEPDLYAKFGQESPGLA